MDLLGWMDRSGPVATANADGRLDVFVLGGGNIVYHNYQTSPGGGWSNWISLGGSIATTPNVAANANGRLELFAQGTDGAGWHAYQQTPGDDWSGWSSFGGGIIGSPSVAANADGRLEIVALGGGNTVYRNWQTSPGGAWSGWNSIGGSVVSAPTVSVDGDGRLEAFAEGTDGAGWLAWQTSAGTGWTDWNSFGGGILGSPSVALDGGGNLEIFALGGANTPYYNAQLPTHTAWSGWTSLGGQITAVPSVGLNFDGRLEIFGVGFDGAIYHNWQLSAGGTWSGWAPLSQASNSGVTDTGPPIIPLPPLPPPAPPPSGSDGSCPACSQYCGTVCMDTATCSCPGESPVCDENSGGYFPSCDNSCTPIVLDAFDEGFQLTDISHGVKFHVDAKGPLLQMSWPAQASRNGWLVLDRNGNGLIDDFTELFGNMTPQPPSSDPNGYRALQVFDELANGGNGDGVIDHSDSVYSHLRVWIDANHNGISESSELHTLPELGIYRIGLRYWRSDYVDGNGNAFRYRARTWDARGNGNNMSYDVFLVVEAVSDRTGH